LQRPGIRIYPTWTWIASTSVPTSQTFRRQDVHNQFRYGIDISDSTGRGPNGMEITSLDGGVNTKVHVQVLAGCLKRRCGKKRYMSERRGIQAKPQNKVGLYEKPRNGNNNGATQKTMRSKQSAKPFLPKFRCSGIYRSEYEINTLLEKVDSLGGGSGDRVRDWTTSEFVLSRIASDFVCGFLSQSQQYENGTEGEF